MKNLVTLIIIGVLFLNLSCAQNRNLVKRTPFEIEKSYFTTWVTDKPNKSSGIDLFLTIAKQPDNVTLEKVYFRGQQTPLNRLDNRDIFKAEFNTTNKDYVLDSDPTKEKNNPMPDLDHSPVTLTEDQALLVYKKAGQIQYYVLENLQNKGMKAPAPEPFNNQP